jgi:hypothetical protein
LKETVGHPYTMLPDDMFQHGAAGYSGQGTLCGSLGASAAIINLVAKDQEMTHNKIIADLINWYASAEFPPNRFDEICKYPGQVQVSPNSPLCHVSVSTWTMAAGTKIDTDDRKDRCAKVAGEVAYQTAIRLNAYADGNFTPSAPGVAEATGYCLSCHGPDAENNQQGQMACGLCHTDHTK